MRTAAGGAGWIGRRLHYGLFRRPSASAWIWASSSAKRELRYSVTRNPASSAEETLESGNKVLTNEPGNLIQSRTHFNVSSYLLNDRQIRT